MLNLRLSIVASATLLIFMTGCAPIELAPPTPPSRELPPIDPNLGPPAAGSQRVVLDTPGDRARVTEAMGTAQTITPRGNVLVTETDRTVCLTPCAVDLTYGTHELHFASTSDDERSGDHTVQVQGSPLAVREVMDRHRTPNPAAQSVSRGLAVTGLVLVGPAIMTGVAGAIMRSQPEVTPDSNTRDVGTTLERTSAGLFAADAALIIAAIVLAYVGQEEHTPGATTEWALPDQERSSSAGPPALLRF